MIIANIDKRGNMRLSHFSGTSFPVKVTFIIRMVHVTLAVEGKPLHDNALATQTIVQLLLDTHF